MERVSDKWIDIEIEHLKKRMKFDNSDAALTNDICTPIEYCLLQEIKARRKAEAEKEKGKAILPLPVKKVDGVSVSELTVKQWFAKINEELDELKEAVGSPMLATPRELYSVTWSDFSDRAIEERCKKIAEEAADTITAITSMLEAIGIDEQQRQAAQRRVNERNERRGRI